MKADPGELTPLEHAILQFFHVRHGDTGFPPPERIGVASRRNSGAGRFTWLAHDGILDQPDGPLGLGRYSQFDMDNLEAGASFWVWLENGKVSYLEIIVNGDGGWDGSECRWEILDPDTAELPSGAAG